MDGKYECDLHGIERHGYHMCEERTGNRIVSVISDKFGAETRTQSLVYKFRLVR
jgi:hypothetical protein